MAILDNIQNSIFQIRSLIQGDSDIRKLVFYDTRNALSQPDISFDAPADHFTVSAIFDVTQAPFDKNTLVSITMSLGNYDDELVMIHGSLKINILTRSELWELSGNKIRPLEIANRVISILNNQKIANSHKLLFSDIELVILNEDVNGYALTFYLEDGSGFKGEF